MGTNVGGPVFPPHRDKLWEVGISKGGFSGRPEQVKRSNWGTFYAVASLRDRLWFSRPRCIFAQPPNVSSGDLQDLNRRGSIHRRRPQIVLSANYHKSRAL